MIASGNFRGHIERLKGGAERVNENTLSAPLRPLRFKKGSDNWLAFFACGHLAKPNLELRLRAYG